MAAVHRLLQALSVGNRRRSRCLAIKRAKCMHKVMYHFIIARYLERN